MAAGRLLLPSWMPALDGDGFPIPNAKVYFYLNLTTTLAPVYADEALTTPLANPVEANSSGRFPAVWADGDALYSASVEAPYGPAGVPFTYDNLSASLGADILIAGAAETAANEAAQSLADIEAAIQAAQDADGVAAVAGAIAGQAAAEAVVADKLQKVGLLSGLAALPSSNAAVFVLGRAASNDGYAGVFEWIGADVTADVATDPRRAVWVAPASAPSGASGAWRRVLEGAVRLEWFGAAGNGVADDTQAVQTWIDVAIRLGLRADGIGGTYLVGAISKNIVAPLEINLPSGCIIKGASGSSDPVISFDGGVARPSVRISGGGEINSALRTYVPATASGTGLVLKRIGNGYRVDGLTFRADRASGKGDSGIAAQECGPGVISRCRFIGHPDIGIYLTGGGSVSSSDDYGDTKVVANYFEDCAIGATARRQINRTIFEGNTFVNCGSGMQTAEAQSGATWVPGARVVVAIGNAGQSISGAFIDFRACAPGSIIANNTCTDWGVTSAASGIGVLGSEGVSVTNNVMVLAAVTATTHAGVTINNYTDGGGTVYTGLNNTVYGNTIIGAETGVRDLSTGPNFSGLNTMLGVTTPYTGLNNTLTSTESGVGIGLGTVTPASPLHVIGAIRSARSGVPAQSVTAEADANGSNLTSWSDPTAAKAMRYLARTDASNTAPSGGALDHVFYERTLEIHRIKATGAVNFMGLTADPSGVANGDMWRRSDLNEIRVRLGATTYKLNVTAA